MDYQRKVRFEYFKVVTRKVDQAPNTPDTYFDFDRWMRIAKSFSLEGRTFDYYDEQARLEKFWYRENEKYWFMNFVRLRETNLPLKSSIDKESVPFDLADDEYIGEEVNSICDLSLGVLMLQRNKYSLGHRGLEHYLNLLWNECDGVKIYLRPIMTSNTYSTALRFGNDYRRLALRFADIREKHIGTEKRNTFTDFFEGLKKYNAVNAEITITVGNTKTALDNETVKDSIESIMENKDIISKAEVGIKYDNEPIEILDLFSNSVHDFIVFTIPKKSTLGSEYAELRMAEKFKEKKGVIMNAF